MSYLKHNIKSAPTAEGYRGSSEFWGQPDIGYRVLIIAYHDIEEITPEVCWYKRREEKLRILETTDIKILCLIYNYLISKQHMNLILNFK